MLQDEIAQAHPGSGSTYANPAALPQGGAWGSWISGYGSADFFEFTAQANRTASVAVTALDEAGQPTETKLLPVIGIWELSDESGDPAPAVNSLGIQLDNFRNDATGRAIRRIGGLSAGSGRLPRRRPSRLLLSGEPALFGYRSPRPRQSCRRRDHAQRHRASVRALQVTRCRQQRQHALRIGKPDPGGIASRAAGRNGDDPGHGSGDRSFFADDRRADLWRVGHGSLASAARCGARNPSWIASRQPASECAQSPPMESRQ